MNDEARALLIVGALLSGVAGGVGFVAGRATAPVPPAEVRYVPIFSPAAQPCPMEVAPVELPAAASAVAPAPEVAIEPGAAKPVEVKPPPPPRPKVEAARPKPQPKPAPAKPRPVRAPTAGECALLRLGIGNLGRDGVIKEGIARRYTRADVMSALAACGL